MSVVPPWLTNSLTTSTLPAANVAPRIVRKKKHGKKETMTLEQAIPAQEALTDAEKLRCEAFARQFIIDFNQTRAAMRMGYSQQIAKTYGNQLFWRSYTQAYLTTLIRGLEERTIVCRNDVLLGLLREANRFDMDACSASRVSAWKEIGKILGMYITKVELSANSSGVMEVPMVASVDQWESMAAPSQNKLLQDARQ